MGLISKLLKTGLTIGALVTAYQATQKTKKETGTIDADAFVRNFKDQAIENTKIVADTVKSQLAGKPAETKGGYRVSDEGENGYTYVDAKPAEKDAKPAAEEAKPAEDKVNEVIETVKEKAPEVIEKVQDIVEDIRENAPEYKARAQEFVEDVKEAAKKALDKDDK
ncbi:MAG: hypothetical protein IJV51_01815 [Oscillospiraceae bacterium]|nr:hypothetical protein [Oscillospiraceae bacterium]